ncbi:MAG: DUF1549 domain-containing protein, partial [Planctomycetes bacterium]|nr:DUF1549 domain-containing protein [Planctomycetota bacterium]
MRNKTLGIERMTLAALAVCVVFASVREGLAKENEVSYLRDVKPLLARHCSNCHGALKQNAGLRLDAARLILKGSNDGAVVVPGRANESLLIEAVTGRAGFRMPPEGEGTPLSDEQIQLVARWIDQGAKGPATEEVVEDARRHWSYLPPQRPSIPSVRNSNWVGNPIDAFVSAQHERHGLVPRPSAPKHVLLRRVYLNLIGLPPSRDELHEFLSDESPDAYERVVDRLLASPQYGERWGRHWMDVWRYSDWYGRRGQNEIR